jgi:hypothetical protein
LERLLRPIICFSGLALSQLPIASFDSGGFTFLFEGFAGGSPSEPFEVDLNGAVDSVVHETAVPEPTTALLLGISLAGLTPARRRRLSH